MSVWNELSRYKFPVVITHQHAGQEYQCLSGLVDYAATIASNKHTYSFQSPEQIISWLWRQPIKLDHGEGPTTAGCRPAQRSRVWPDDGLNCWEAVAHLLGVAFCHAWRIEFHVFDAIVGSQRHVFPAIRPLAHRNELPEPLVIQPPASTGRSLFGLRADIAQAWYNDLLGTVHFVGDKLLTAYGLSSISDTLSEIEGDELPNWSRTQKQRDKRAAELIKKAADGNMGSNSERRIATPSTTDHRTDESPQREWTVIRLITQRGENQT